jgi:hypothetical protein
LPALQVTKSAAPAAVLATGADVTFTFVVKNSGPVSVTLDSLADDRFGPLAGSTGCHGAGSTFPSPATILAPGASCSFTLVRFLSGPVGSSHTNRFTAQALDAQQNPASAWAEATVTFTEQPQPGAALYLFSSDTGGTLGGVTFADEDVVAWDGSTWSLLFDGSLFGLSPADLDALEVDTDGSLLLSLDIDLLSPASPKSPMKTSSASPPPSPATTPPGPLAGSSTTPTSP